jgi:hypothetical protein
MLRGWTSSVVTLEIDRKAVANSLRKKPSGWSISKVLVIVVVATIKEEYSQSCSR